MTLNGRIRTFTSWQHPIAQKGCIQLAIMFLKHYLIIKNNYFTGTNKYDRKNVMFTFLS